MNLFELFVKIGVKDEASKNLANISGKIGNGLKTAAKIGTTAVTAAAAGIVALTKESVESYAEYEQLVGGAELMFGKAFETVKKNSQDAYKTVQLSQNEYLKQVNGFAVGLKTALGGNEQAAAELSHRIVQAEADIIAATGNTAENVQNAFNGIMKSNFTMLDNLQIGITPTKEGFQEVIDKVNKWNAENGKATKYQMGNLADMQSALVDYIEKVDMSGYAQAEASKTIQGSLASMKGAWNNFLVGLSTDSANFDKLTSDLVKSVETFANNLLPKIEVTLNGASKVVSKVLPEIVSKVPGLLKDNVPILLTGVKNLIGELFGALPQLFDMFNDDLIDEILSLIVTTIESSVNAIPVIIEKLLPFVFTLVEKLFKTLESSKILDIVLNAANVLLQNVGKALNKGLPLLIDSVGYLLEAVIEHLVSPKNITEITATAISLVSTLATGIISALPQLYEISFSVFKGLYDAFTQQDWGAIGKSFIAIVLDGFSTSWQTLKKWFSFESFQFFEEYINFIGSWGKRIVDYCVSLFENIINDVLGFFSNIGTYSSGFFEDIITKIQDFLDRPGYYLGLALGNYIKELKTFYTETVPNAWSSFKTWLETSFNELKENVKTFFTETIPEAWSGIKEKAKDIMQRVSDIIVEFFTVVLPQKWEEFKTNAVKKIISIKDWFKDLPKNLKEIGKNIVEGLWKGLKERWNKLKSDAKGLLDDFINGFKDGLGIASPSKLFKLFGEYIDEGLSIGLLDNADSPISAIESVSDQLVSAFDPDLATEYMTTYDGYGSSAYGGSSSAYSSEEASSSVNITFGEKAFYIANFNGNSESEVDNFVDAVIDKLTSKIQSKEAVFA